VSDPDAFADEVNRLCEAWPRCNEILDKALEDVERELEKVTSEGDYAHIAASSIMLRNYFFRELVWQQLIDHKNGRDDALERVFCMIEEEWDDWDGDGLLEETSA